MAKRWRDEVATRTPVLKRRDRADAGDETETPERRRRIAGERPGTKPADGEPERPDETATAESEPKASDAGKDGPDDSQSLAQTLAAMRPERSRVVAAATATVIGIVVGAVLTGLVYAGMRTFEAIYNTPAGNGTGAVVLVVVMTVSALAGRFLLIWRGLPDPNATTLLGIMLMAIVTLAALLPIVFSAWMLLITPALGGVSYLVSHLLVAHFGDHS